MLLLNLKLFSQNYLVSKFSAGSCNNYIAIDEYIDSLCKIYNITHLYYLEGISKHELKDYSKEIFLKEYDSSSLVDDEQISKWQLNKKNETNLLFYISGDRVINITNIFEFDVKDLISLKIMQNNLSFNQIERKTLKKDSLSLTYSKKVKIDKTIRLNKRCKFVKLDSHLYILEPLFNKTLYKVNANTGLIINKIELSDLLNYDSVLYHHYFLFSSKIDFDTLNHYALIAGKNPEKQYFDMFVDDNKLFVCGTYSMLTFFQQYQPLNSNYNIVYQVDLDLVFENYYLDKYNSYGRQYPSINQAFSDNSNRIQAVMAQDYNNVLNVAKLIYYKLEPQNHLLHKYDKDTLIIPELFSGQFYSNTKNQINNIHTKYNPIWLLSPFPILYYPNENIFHDLVYDTIGVRQDFLKPPKESNYLYKTFTVSDFRKIIILFFNNQFYVIDYDLENKKINSKKVFQNLTKFNLNLNVDNNLKLFYINLEYDFKNGNYIYYE
jgi:hypothetical protein